MSYDDVTLELGPGGLHDGWSYATRAELETLWAAFVPLMPVFSDCVDRLSRQRTRTFREECLTTLPDTRSDPLQAYMNTGF